MTTRPARVRVRAPSLATVLSTLLLVGVAVGLGLSRLPAASSQAGGSAPPIDKEAYRPLAYDPVKAAPPLRLTDSAGNPFGLERLLGRVVLVSFGYANCPDVCPTTLAIDRDVVLERPDRAAVVFVTVDPERDTAEALASYLKYFGAPMTGLTGTPQAIAAVAADWGVSYQKGPVNDGGGYAMNHSAGVFVVDPTGRLRYLFPYGTPAVVLVDAVDELSR